MSTFGLNCRALYVRRLNAPDPLHLNGAHEIVPKAEIRQPSYAMIRSVDVDSAEAERQVLTYVEIGEFRSSNLGALAHDSSAVAPDQVLVEILYFTSYHDTRIQHDTPCIPVNGGAPDSQFRTPECLAEVVGNQWSLGLV